ncbi:helix-turn-helix transcriptional regulator [Sporolactobacillus nakayamae]|uniref:Transcriptional regulator, AraC family n=1 Tax=Sporolactobacillus nakayamae TaxID=269670 RepID=A0A1I2PLF0_9BACL|nr:AraC family transcriptional regulator [Sporolactobacillus nakayamae]SFG16243.1 transcriptional regulator, AraC family [Sporolactobacillus nakayamae]
MKNETNYSPKRNSDRHAYLDIILRKGMGYGWRYQENWHEEMQFYYVVSGQGRIRCESDVFDLHTGETLLINCNELHVIESLCEQLTFYSIRIDLAAMFQDMPDLRQAAYVEPLMQQRIVFNRCINENEPITPLLRRLIHEHRARLSGFELSMKSDMLQILLILIRSHIQQVYTKKRLGLKLNNLNQLKSAFSYLNDHYEEAITVHHLAARAHMSEAHFCRTFKRLYGRSAIAHMNELRVNKAEELLRTTPLTITEIAFSVGFNDANYFSRVFKKLRGRSPQQTRSLKESNVKR